MKRRNGEAQNRKGHGLSQTQIENRVLKILNRHIGKEKAIGMGELFERVYGKPWWHRINDTTPIRRVIKKLRNEGALIASTKATVGGGYYQARSVHEMQAWFDEVTYEIVNKSIMISRMKQIGLLEFLGQLQLNLKEGAHGEHHGAEEQRGQ
jgi:hypothetical protein